VTPQILNAHTVSVAPTATSCTMLMAVGCWCPPHTLHTSVLTCRLLKRKPSPQPRRRLAAAPIECNTKHGVTYTNRKCQRCGTGVDNEHHQQVLLFECSHVALVASRSKHMALFDGVSGVREWMVAVVAAYKPELAATHGSCMQDMMHCLKTGLDGQPNVTPAS
jgi:hypothetical protein